MNTLCRGLKCAYYQAEISSTADSKGLYKFTNALLHNSNITSLPDHDEPGVLAQEFVDFFGNKVKRITDSFPISNHVPDTRNSGPAGYVRTLSNLDRTTDAEIKKIVMAGNSKSCQLDPIPTTLLKDCIDCLLPTLTLIVNTSISENIMPTSLKAATVTPLLKKPTLDCNNMANYRPVSNLPYLSKLIEKVVVRQLDTHLTTNSQHQLHQSAYRKLHSTETALIKITDDLLCAMDSSQCSILIMLDQSAAFDTVDQKLLLERFEQWYGISGTALRWLQSYFLNRTQEVTIRRMSSSPRPLDTGFPQGSVLGPFSYPVYTSPLFGIAHDHSVSMHMYADDTQVYVSFKPGQCDVAEGNMTRCIYDLSAWMSRNHLKLNEAKTEYLLIGSSNNRKKVPHLMDFQVGNEVVQASDSAKNIGAVLDSQLSLNAHVNSIVKTCYFHLHRISQIRPYLTKDATVTLICSLVLSRLDYANSLLYGLPDVLLRRLQVVQNNAARLVFRKKKTEHVTHLLKQLHWLPVKQRIQYKINLITFKALHDLAPAYIKDMISIYQPPRSLRSSTMGLLAEKRTRLVKSGDRAFSVAAPKLWNLLPENIRMLEAVDPFKSALKTHLFRNAYS